MVCTVSGVKKERFTLKAAVLWGTVPAWAKEKVLKNCFCRECRKTVEMVEFKGQEIKGDLVLTGRCANCGGKVVRVLELSQARVRDN